VAEAEALLAWLPRGNSLFAAGPRAGTSMRPATRRSGSAPVAALWLIAQLASRGTGRRVGGDWKSALLLVATPAFSLAYLSSHRDGGADPVRRRAGHHDRIGLAAESAPPPEPGQFVIAMPPVAGNARLDRASRWGRS